uniref:Uncharacterized protein n=1 Tax=Cucumis melo TaxID=3656 RepID=A0A9I9E8E5_CUCME
MPKGAISSSDAHQKLLITTVYIPLVATRTTIIFVQNHTLLKREPNNNETVENSLGETQTKLEAIATAMEKAASVMGTEWLAKEELSQPRGNNCEQEEAKEIIVLSPRTSTIRLLTVEDSLGDLHDKFDRMMDSIETLNRRMDGLLAPARIEANAISDRNDGNRGGRQARRNHRNLPDQRNDRRRMPNEVLLRYANDDTQEDYEVWQNGQ